MKFLSVRKVYVHAALFCLYNLKQLKGLLWYHLSGALYLRINFVFAFEYTVPTENKHVQNILQHALQYQIPLSTVGQPNVIFT